MLSIERQKNRSFESHCSLKLRLVKPIKTEIFDQQKCVLRFILIFYRLEKVSGGLVLLIPESFRIRDMPGKRKIYINFANWIERLWSLTWFAFLHEFMKYGRQKHPTKTQNLKALAWVNQLVVYLTLVSIYSWQWGQIIICGSWWNSVVLSEDGEIDIVWFWSLCDDETQLKNNFFRAL